MRFAAAVVLLAACSKPVLERAEAESILRTELGRKTDIVPLSATDCPAALVTAGFVVAGTCAPTATGRAWCYDDACTALNTTRGELVSFVWPATTINNDYVRVTFTSKWSPTPIGNAVGATGGPMDLNLAGYTRRDGTWHLTFVPEAAHGSHPPF